MQGTSHDPQPLVDTGREVKERHTLQEVEKARIHSYSNDRDMQREREMTNRMGQTEKIRGSDEDHMKYREMTNRLNQMAEELEKMKRRNKSLEESEKNSEQEKQEMAEKLEKMRNRNRNLEDREKNGEKEKERIAAELEKMQCYFKDLENREREKQGTTGNLEKIQHWNEDLKDREKESEKLVTLQHRTKYLEEREKYSEKQKKEMAEKLEHMQYCNRHLENRVQQIERERRETVEKLEQAVHDFRNLEDGEKRREKEMAAKLEKVQQRNRCLEYQEKHRETEKQEMMNQIHQMAEKLEHAQHHNKSLEEVNRRQSEELRLTTGQLRASETQHQQTRQALEVKVSELKAAQTFLTKEDSLSGADVITMVGALNAEILQISAFIADSLDSSDGSMADELSSERKEAREQAIRRIGEPLVQTLTTNFLHEELDRDPLPLQIALQIALARLCAEITQTWTPGHPYYESMFVTMYSRLREEGEP